MDSAEHIEFKHLAPAARIFCGGGSLAQLGSELTRLKCGRPFLFHARSLAGRPQLDLVKRAWPGEWAGAYGELSAHSPMDSIGHAAAALAAAQADGVVVVGGGSALVSARAAVILLAEQQPIEALSTTLRPDGRLASPKLLKPKLPIIAVPTTPTTSMAKAGSALRHPVLKRRVALFDPKTRAGAIFIHPAIAASAPAHLVRSAALNALSMAIEGLESGTSNPFADAQLMHAVRLLVEHLPLQHRDPDDAATRCQLMIAAALCAQGTDQAGTGICSVLAHAIGARFDLVNGTLNAVLLPLTMGFNEDGDPARQRLLRAALDTPAGSRPRDSVAELLRGLGAIDRLRDAGVPADATAALVADAQTDWFLSQVPKPASTEQLTRLLNAAW